MKQYIGEFIGTMLLVFIGCGAVAVSVVYGTLNLWGVAVIFGMGVSLAIYTVQSIGPAHLNPAVSMAMVLSKKLSLKKLPYFVLAQCCGAFMGAVLVLVVFNQAIIKYEALHGIVRGGDTSYRSAMMFGEYFPNPAFEARYSVSHVKACFFEGIGSFFLVFSIFILSETKRVKQKFVPLFIGLTVTILICFIAPYTQGGFNPARDFSPRIVAYFGGWQQAAFPSISYSFITVYILSPILGGVLAALVFSRLKKQLQRTALAI